MFRTRQGHSHFTSEQPQAAARLCEHPGCPNAGEYRAPKDRAHLTDYYWFCLDHVREYNKAWDYYQGMSEAEIERQVRHDTTWQRPTWKMGDWRSREKVLRHKAAHDAGFGAYWDGAADTPPPPNAAPRGPEVEALALLGLQPPTDFETIKRRYRELAKRHHPDANGGDKLAEERLKEINQAYNTLKTAYAQLNGGDEP